jgi:hypothetical protein
MRPVVTIAAAIAMIALAACAGPQGSPGPAGEAVALPGRLVLPARRARKASKDPSVLRAPLGNKGRPALRDRPDRSGLRGRRVQPVAKAQLDLPANADHQGLRAPLVHPVPPDHQALKVIPALHRQFASSLERIVFAAETTRYWWVSFAQAAPPTERSARPLERQQRVYAYVDDLSPDHALTRLQLLRPRVARIELTTIRSKHIALVIFSPRSGRVRAA